MQCLKPHTILIIVTESMTAVYCGESIIHTAGPGTSTLTAFPIFRVGCINGIEAGTGDAYGITCTTTNTTCLIILPHIESIDVRYHVFRNLWNMNNGFILFYKFRLIGCFRICVKKRCKLITLTFYQDTSFFFIRTYS